MYWPRKLTRDINIRVPPYAIIYQQRRRDLINITSYIITIRFLHCALSSSSEQSTLRVFLTYSPRSNTTPSITLLSFEFTTGNTLDVVLFQPYKYYPAEAFFNTIRTGCSVFDKIEAFSAI